MKFDRGSEYPVWLLFGLGFADLLAACAAPDDSGEIKSAKERQPVDARAENIAELVAGNSDFGFDLFQKLAG